MAGEELFGPVPEGWEYKTLGAACEDGGGEIQTGPFGSQLHASDYVPIGIPSIMPRNIGDNRIIEDGIARITPEDAQRLSRYLVRAGDIVYSRRGDVERRALVRKHEDGWLCGTGCLRVRLGEKGADPRYASYYLGHPNVREWIVRHAHGATMPNLNTSIMAACPFLEPPPTEQRAIAHILGTLDDKIELNRRMNGTLEAMARALFKSWFVAFDPVRAKAEGRDPGLPAAVADLFPDAFEDSEPRQIPKGWALEPVEALVQAVGGTTPSTKNPEFWEGGTIHWTTPKDLSSLSSPVLLDTARKITEAGLEKISSGLLPAGTLLLSSRAPVGYLAIAQIPIAVNQGYIAILPGGRVSPLWMLFWAHANMERIRARAGGTTFQEISKRNFRPIKVVVPAPELERRFGDVAGSLFERILVNERESLSLSAVRDTLLPKLVSGELRIEDAESLLSRVE